MGIGSTSTIRHHRFALKEKERQAKTFLAIMELLKEKDQHAPAFVPPHKTATMLDDRYAVTDEEQKKLSKVSNGREKWEVKEISPKKKTKTNYPSEISGRFEKI